MKIDVLKNQLTEEQLKFINNAIMENKNPNKIRDELKNKFNKDITYYLIKQFILRELKKEWKEKAWKDVVEQKGPSEGDSLKTNNETSTNNDYSLPSMSNEENLDISLESNHLQTILKVLYHIENQNKEIIKSIASLNQKLDSHLNNHKEQIDNFIQIYSSETIKTTLNLNKKIKDEIDKLIGNQYKIKKNDSKLINTALLIALFNEKNNIK